MAAALRDLICYEGDRCRHGHTIDVRLSHQDLAELVGAARPVVSAELVQMRREGLVEYTRCYFCVDDLDGLVPEALDKYWQLSLEFLQIAKQMWPAHLAEIQKIEPVSP